MWRKSSINTRARLRGHVSFVWHICVLCSHNVLTLNLACLLLVAPYRDVPKPHELGFLGSMRPHLADNAEALVDWALSHVPKRDGPRRSRKHKRGEQKCELIASLAQRRIEEQREATKRKIEKRRRVQQEIKKIKEDAKVINAAREEKLRAAGLLRSRLN